MQYNTDAWSIRGFSRKLTAMVRIDWVSSCQECNLGEFAVTTLVGVAGLMIGLAFGAVTRWSDFCALGALADISIYGDFRRLRCWLLAIVTAVGGTHAFHWAGVIDIYDSIYLGSNLGWFGAILGGLIFGYGTVMARGCGGRSLIRAAGGDLRSLVSLLALGIFAYMTLRGLTGAAREWMEGGSNLDLAHWQLQSQGIPEFIARVLGVQSEPVRIGLSLIVIAGGVWYCFEDKAFRSSPKHVIAGLAIGAMVTLGWMATGVLGFDEFEPVALTSLSFVRPVGDGLQYLMTFTGATISFGVAVIAGIILGGFAVATANRTFRIDGFKNAREMSDYMTGGALMGVGGVMALGCTIGQGVTGIATLSLGSLLAVGGIVAGGAVAISRMGLDPAEEALSAPAGE